MEKLRRFPIPDNFNDISCKHCVALFLLRDIYPSETTESATLTLVKFEDRVFGVTCKHVVLRAAEIGADLATVRGEVRRFPPTNFYQPRSPTFWLQESTGIDIAIAELPPSLPQLLGKQPLEFDTEVSLENIQHGIAVGYPEKIKFRISDSDGYYVASTCVHLIAKNHTTKEADTFMLFSSLSVLPPLLQLSGLSGGPVFWTTHATYGLLGIVRSAPSIIPGASNADGEDFGGGPRVSIRAERITRERFSAWIAEMPAI